MPEEKTTLEVKPTSSAKKTESAEPHAKVLAPNSPWKQLHSDGSIGTYVMEIKDAGVLVRTESPKENSESMVFLPNVNLSQLPDCK